MIMIIFEDATISNIPLNACGHSGSICSRRRAPESTLVYPYKPQYAIIACDCACKTRVRERDAIGQNSKILNGINECIDKWH